MSAKGSCIFDKTTFVTSTSFKSNRTGYAKRLSMRMPAKFHNDPATLERIDVKGDEQIGERANWKWFDDKREETPPE